MENYKFRWGILGGGFISSQFAKAVADAPGMEVAAVASLSGRNPFGIRAERYVESYEEIAEAEDIDGVYIGTIHPMHYPCARLCLEAGKPVLCEKPVTVNAQELEELLAIARERKVFFMEAMWSRYLPAVRYVKSLLDSREYGRIHYMHITFGYCGSEDNKRLFQAALGGGALLDIGIYGLNLAEYWLGEATVQTHAWAEQNAETVDLTTSVQSVYPGGAMADMTFSIKRNLLNSAHIVTDRAEIVLPYFWRPERVELYVPNGGFHHDRLIEVKEFPIESNGYQHEAIEAAACIQRGRLESADMTWEDSLRLMREMDEIRKLCGICYPQDKHVQ